MERLNKLERNNEDNSTLDEKTKKSILAQYNRGLYEDEGIDDDYVDAVHNVNRELESDGEEEGGENQERKTVTESKPPEKKESTNPKPAQSKEEKKGNPPPNTDYHKNIQRNRKAQQIRRQKGEKKRGLGI